MYLCIDTITECAGITLVDTETAIYLRLDPQNSSEGIIDTIDKILKDAKIGLSDLHGVFIIKGPGSFTGLRVGLSVANQFAHQLKIPIIGLRCNEWWLARATENATYIQSMNKAEVYIVQGENRLITDAQELAPYSPARWVGQLTEDHRSWLPSDFEEVRDLLSVEDAWKRIIRKWADSKAERRTYDLVEPFYGKDPNITKSKSQVSL